MKPTLLLTIGLLVTTLLAAATSGHAEPDTAHTEPHAPADPHAGPVAGTHTEPTADQPTDTHQPESGANVAQEIASMLRIGEAKSQQQDWESAQLAYTQVLAARKTATLEQIKDALLGLARVHRGELRLTKACAIYERYIKDYPGDERLPVVYLELGRCLRALGATRLAIARFYSVINSTLKLPEEGADTYRQLARTAQFEIAETYFLSGDYEQAFRFYSRLSLLDLAPADRGRAAFKSAFSLNLQGDHEKAVSHLRTYLSLYPDGEDAPEARHLLSLALRRLGRTQESLAATLELLRIEQTNSAADPKTWNLWQRKTGNQLANEFYEQGDITTSLTIYECLQELGGPPEWLLPVRYQIGLCQERLRQNGLARATYEAIITDLRPTPDQAVHPHLKDLDTMAAWRLKHLDWLDTTRQSIRPAPAGAGDTHSTQPLAANP